MSRFLLDTNHLGAVLAPVSPVRERLIAAYRAGHRFGTIHPILCEIQAGLQSAFQPKCCLQQISRLATMLRIWPLDDDVVRHYGRIYLQLKHMGRHMSQIDMIVAASCRSWPVTLLTTDRDFEALPDIPTENWI